MTMRLYNTLTRQEEPFAPATENTVRMYTCGLTVYARGHIGNFRTFICIDVLRRTLKYLQGHHVRQVMNFTDVDDRTIAGAQKAGVGLRVVARVLGGTRLLGDPRHRLDVGERRAHGGKPRQHRLDGQPRFDDLQRIDPVGKLGHLAFTDQPRRAEEGALTLPPPDRALRLEHAQRLANGPAADLHLGRELAFRRQPPALVLGSGQMAAQSP